MADTTATWHDAQVALIEFFFLFWLFNCRFLVFTSQWLCQSLEGSLATFPTKHDFSVIQSAITKNQDDARWIGAKKIESRFIAILTNLMSLFAVLMTTRITGSGLGVTVFRKFLKIIILWRRGDSSDATRSIVARQIFVCGSKIIHLKLRVQRV